MIKKYLIDTCVWRDFYEDRFGINGRPLGKYAGQLFMQIIKKKDILYFSDLTVRELKKEYSENEVSLMFNFLFISKILKKVEITEYDYNLAKSIASEKDLPVSDALHAVLARKVNAILISQDNHFQKLKEFVIVKKPEQVI